MFSDHRYRSYFCFRVSHTLLFSEIAIFNTTIKSFEVMRRLFYKTYLKGYNQIVKDF